LGDNQVEEDFDLESDDEDDDIAEGFDDEELEDVKDGELHISNTISYLSISYSTFACFAFVLYASYGSSITCL
jgi:hypothetical protein